VKSFYGTTEVPFCNHWDHNERRPGPLVHTSCRALNTRARSAFKRSVDASRRSPLPVASNDPRGPRSWCFLTIAAVSLHPSI
jgi:hypothetical protein